MKSQGETDFWQELGRSLCAPLYFSYVNGILEQARKTGASRILFLAREGHILQRVWNAFFAEKHPIPTDYIWASRRCYSMACLKELDEKARRFLLSGKQLTGRERLHQLGWDWPLKADSATDDTWLNDADLQKRILVTAAVERANLIGYLESIGLLDPTPSTALVVDTGWHGSLQARLQQLLVEAGSGLRLHGCYLGTIHPLAETLHPEQAHGFFFNQSRPDDICRAMQNSLLLVESLFAGPHPSVMWMRRTPKGYEPFFASDQESPEDLAKVDRMQQAALEMLEEHAPFWQSRPEAVRESALVSLTGLLRRPSRGEAAHLGDLRLFGGFGQAPRREPLARPERNGKWISLRDQYRRCNWRSGFLARLSPWERATLRPLIVGMRRDRR